MDFKHEISGFKVRGDKNYVDENVSEYGMWVTKSFLCALVAGTIVTMSCLNISF